MTSTQPGSGYEPDSENRSGGIDYQIHCDDCGRGFLTQQAHNAHQRVHADEDEDLIVAPDGGEILDETQDEDVVPVLMVGYEDEADLEYEKGDSMFSIENHDELVEAGLTFEEIRGMKRSQVEEFGLWEDVITPGDPLWNDRLEDLEAGDGIRVSDLDDEEVDPDA